MDVASVGLQKDEPTLCSRLCTPDSPHQILRQGKVHKDIACFTRRSTSPSLPTKHMTRNQQEQNHLGIRLRSALERWQRWQRQLTGADHHRTLLQEIRKAWDAFETFEQLVSTQSNKSRNLYLLEKHVV